MNAGNGTFQLVVGGMLTLPSGGFRAEGSRNAGAFPQTPLMMTVWKEKGGSVCHVNLQIDEMAEAKMIRLFIPEEAKPGDSLRIVWFEKGCACAELANA